MSWPRIMVLDFGPKSRRKTFRRHFPIWVEPTVRRGCPYFRVGRRAVVALPRHSRIDAQPRPPRLPDPGRPLEGGPSWPGVVIMLLGVGFVVALFVVAATR